MKVYPTTISVILLAALPFTIWGDSARLTLGTFSGANDFSVIAENEDLRFAELSRAESGPPATHMLIHHILPIDPGATIGTSPYSAIDFDSGEVVDTGHIYLRLPAGSVDRSGTSSPVFGIVPRAGTWENHNPFTPQALPLGGSAGTAEYSTSVGAFSIAVSLNRVNWNALTSFVVTDPYTIRIAPFSLSNGFVSFPFRESVLRWNGSSFRGVILSSDTSVAYNSLMFTIDVDQLNDSDFDGIPDISDDDERGMELSPGWNFDQRTGLCFGLNDNWGWSLRTGFTYFAEFPWLYSPTQGWFCLVHLNDSFAFYYNYESGWHWANDNDSGIHPY